MTSDGDEPDEVVSGLLALAAELERDAEQLRSTASLLTMYEGQVKNLEEDIKNLELAMESRAAIEQAKGILMAADPELDADGAFDVLRRTSQRENVKVREIAERLIESRDPQSGR